MYDLVEIIWDDASTNDDWHSLNKLPTLERVRTVGYLVGSYRTHYVVAASWGIKQDGSVELGNSWAIPIGMVVCKQTVRSGECPPPTK